MRSVRRGRRRFRPKLDDASYSAVNHREEGDGSVSSHSVGDCYIRNCLRLAANDPIDGETPRTVRGVLLIHAREALSPANALSALGPFKHEILCQHGSDRVKVVRGHESPELASYLNCGRLRHVESVALHVLAR